MRIECEWSNETRAEISLFAIHGNVILANARVFECNQVVRTRFTLSKYDPKLVCAVAIVAVCTASRGNFFPIISMLTNAAEHYHA